MKLAGFGVRVATSLIEMRIGGRVWGLGDRSFDKLRMTRSFFGLTDWGIWGLRMWGQLLKWWGDIWE